MIFYLDMFKAEDQINTWWMAKKETASGKTMQKGGDRKSALVSVLGRLICVLSGLSRNRESPAGVICAAVFLNMGQQSGKVCGSTKPGKGFYCLDSKQLTIAHHAPDAREKCTLLSAGLWQFTIMVFGLQSREWSEFLLGYPETGGSAISMIYWFTCQLSVACT